LSEGVKTFTSLLLPRFVSVQVFFIGSPEFLWVGMGFESKTVDIALQFAFRYYKATLSNM